MRTRKWVGVGSMIASVVALAGVGSARADVASDRAAAILIFPRIVVNPSTDTILQITNTSNETAQNRPELQKVRKPLY